MRSLILGLFLATGLLGTARADEWQACQSGDQEACLEAARVAQAAGDFAALLRISEKGCELGNVISCSDIGMIYLAGLGVHVDLGKALPLVMDGCDAGYSRACTNLGWMHYEGYGVERDLAKAIQY
ncbi:tetratricopeptide repeat protein, partial [Tabrizicola sp.]|uniref:tetratricopeptide repeat protein n=1 Tax=Tabrizicola sp. TaxID=2005166 RepID=UPI003F3DF4AE